MTEQLKPPSVDLVTSALPIGYELEDPRDTLVVLGEEIVLGDTIFPDAESFPGWSLTFFTFKETDPDRDGCIFSLQPNTATPVGLVGEPPNQEENAHFAEWIIKGSGYLLVESPEGVVQSIEVSSQEPTTQTYGTGTMVAYIAGGEGLVGINIGTPSQIPEGPLPLNDPRASRQLWEKYQSLNSSKEVPGEV